MRPITRSGGAKRPIRRRLRLFGNHSKAGGYLRPFSFKNSSGKRNRSGPGPIRSPDWKSSGFVRNRKISLDIECLVIADRGYRISLIFCQCDVVETVEPKLRRPVLRKRSPVDVEHTHRHGVRCAKDRIRLCPCRRCRNRAAALIGIIPAHFRDQINVRGVASLTYNEPIRACSTGEADRPVISASLFARPFLQRRQLPPQYRSVRLE